MTTFNIQLKLDTPKTYPLIQGYGNLDDDQKDNLTDNGYDVDNETAEYDMFWFDENGVGFCINVDLILLEGAFDKFGEWKYMANFYSTSHLAKLHYNEHNKLTHISLAEVV